MKKLLLTGVLLVIAVSNLSAQTEFGVKSGYFRSSLVDPSTNNAISHDGIYIGASLGYSLSETFSIQTEVNYLRRLGHRAEYGFYEELDQLQVPVLANLRIGKKFRVFVGPNMLFLLTDYQEFDTFSFGIKYGVSYDISEKLSIEASFNNGFQNVLESQYNEQGRFRGFQLGLTYKFR
ncbi:porin family protein [Flavobacteriaceae bacterium]|nr:porin family protein [Flavobacteriaceae bacterium]